MGDSCDWLSRSVGRSGTKGSESRSRAAGNVSHHRLISMSQRQVVAIAIVTAFLTVTITPVSNIDTIGKDYPSGAAAKVSHNRSVRMLSNQWDDRSGGEGWRAGSGAAKMFRSAGGGRVRGQRGAAGTPHNRGPPWERVLRGIERLNTWAAWHRGSDGIDRWNLADFSAIVARKQTRLPSSVGRHQHGRIADGPSHAPHSARLHR